MRESDEEFSARMRKERREKRWVLAIGVAIVAVLGAADLAWNQWVYGDWRCAYARCAKVEVKP